MTVAYRRTRDEMPAINEEIEEAQREGAQFTFLANPVEFVEADGRVSGVVCERMELGEPDASGRRRPIPTGQRFTITADTVLTAIGESSRSRRASLAMSQRSDSGMRVDALGRDDHGRRSSPAVTSPTWNARSPTHSAPASAPRSASTGTSAPSRATTTTASSLTACASAAAT